MEERILIIIQNILKENYIKINYDSTIANIIDSITFIKIIVALEGEFDFEFDDEMLIITKYPTIKALVEYVEDKIRNC